MTGALAQEAQISGPFRVLVIDDDPGVREYLEALVSRQGYEVFTVPGGEEALSSLPTTRPDLVTLDVVLDGMDGLETLRRLKKNLPDVPVIMLSGHGQARTIVEAMQLGAADFLRKPFEVEELELAFQRALENRALRQEVEELRGQAGRGTNLILGSNEGKMREVREIIEQVADTDITVLVRGESGTGKELVARGAAPALGPPRQPPSSRSTAPRSRRELLESELFGFREGRFHRRTEAQARQVRVRQRRHDLPRRDQRDAPEPCRPSCCRCSRTASSRGSAVRPTSRWTPASSRPRTATWKRRSAQGIFPRGPLLPAERRDCRHVSRPCGSGSTGRQCPLLVDHFLAPLQQQYRKPGARSSRPRTMERCSCKLPLAGQRARAREHGEADVVLGQRADLVLQEIHARNGARRRRTESDASSTLDALGVDLVERQGNRPEGDRRSGANRPSSREKRVHRARS